MLAHVEKQPVGPFAPAQRVAESTHLQVAPGNGVQPCPRYPVGLGLFLRWDGEERYRSAVDVSAEGLFVESPDQAPLGRMIHLRTRLPGGQSFEVLCRIERVVSTEEAAFCGGLPGMGLRFVLMGPALEARWEEYLDQLRKGTLPQPVDLERSEHLRPAPVELTRRVEPRRAGRIEVRLRDLPGRGSLHTINVSSEGMFIATPAPMEVGAQLNLQVVHPITGSVLCVEAEVRWVRTQGHEPGMGVRILEGDDPGCFPRFVNEG
ncbi:MAG: PilZ domain-containing protein [Myxococcota bacterium]|nr:PilZ domain-containing protein [Myxococcota bacterium]